MHSGSQKSRRRTAYRYIITLASSLKYPKNSHRKCWNLPLPTSPLSFDPSPGNLREYSHKFYIARNYSHWPTFLPLIMWVCLHSDFCGGLRNTYLFCTECVSAIQGHPRSLILAPVKRACVCDFLLVINSNFGLTLHRFCDTATYWLKIANFSYPTLI